jgi:hypothetical protein
MSTRRSWWPPLIIVGAACAFCWPVFLGRLMLPADMCLLMLPWRALVDRFPWFHQPYNPMLDPIQQYLPWRIYAVESLRAGILPLWNPYAFCGTPFLANLQSTVLYPPNLLFLITGARYGFGVSAIVHLTLGGLFTYAFLTTLGLRRPAALLAALVVMFNGYTVAWLEYPTLSLWVFMWLPAILLSYERSLRAPRSWWPLLTALAVGMQFLGGHFQVSAYVMIAFALYAGVRLIGAQGAPRGHTLTWFLVPVALGLALAAAQMLPTLELAGHTGRASQGPRGALSTAFPITHFILYLVPNFFGNPVDYNYWGHYRDPAAFNFFETACYVGLLPLLLAVWSLRRWREPVFWFFAALTVFAVLAAVGSPVYLLLYWLAPGFRQLAGLGRALCLAAFGFAGLAALGLDSLLAASQPLRVRPMLIFGVLASAAVAISWFIFQPVIAALDGSWRFDEYLRRQIIAFAFLAAAACVLVAARARLRIGPGAFAALSIVLLLLDLFGLGLRFNPFTDPRMAYPETDSTRWLERNLGHARFTSLATGGLDWMPHNAPMIFGLRDIHGSDSLRVRSSFEIVSPPGRSQATYPDPDSPLLDLLGVRYLMTRRKLGGRWRLAHDSEAPIYENTRALPRAYLADASPDLRDESASPVSFVLDSPDALALAVRADHPGLLVLTDSYYPGWRARVDGRPSEIQRVRDAFRGVRVPAGEHLVELRYEPASFRVGLFLSLLAAALLAGSASAVFLASRASASFTAARS